MGQSSSGEVSVQTQDPWGPQQPYLQDLFKLAQGMYTGRVYNYPSIQKPSQQSPQPPPGVGETPSPVSDIPVSEQGGWTPIPSGGETTDPNGLPPYAQPVQQDAANQYNVISGSQGRPSLPAGGAADWFATQAKNSGIFDISLPFLSKPGGDYYSQFNDPFGGTQFAASQNLEYPYQPFPSGGNPQYGGQQGGYPPINDPLQMQQNTTGATGYSTGSTKNPMPYADYAMKEGINIPTPQFATLPGINPAQLNFMNMLGGASQSIAPYSGLAAGALAGQLNPWSNPYQQAAMSTLGSQTGALKSILGGGMAPGATYAPNIGFSAQDPMSATYGRGGNTPGLYNTINNMMTGTPNMDVWGPLMQQSASNAARTFNEQIMPAIRSESISAGAYGGPKHQQAMGLAAGRLGESIMAGQSGLAKEAAMAALGQQQAGAGLGSQLAQTGGQLNLGAQQLGGDIAKTQAQMGLQSQLGNQGAWNQYLDTLGRTAGTAGNLSSQAYQTGTSGINQAAAGMPQALQTMLMPANVQGQLGDYIWNLDQAKIQDQMNRFNMPYDMLAKYGQMVTGQYGGTTSTPVQGKSPLASALGGAALGGSIGGPWGAAGGGLAGLLGLL